MTTHFYHLYRFSQTSESLTWNHYLAQFEVKETDSFLLAALDAFCCPRVRRYDGRSNRAKHWRRKDKIRLQVSGNERNIMDWFTLATFDPSSTPAMIGEYIEDHLPELFPQGIAIENCDECGLSVTDGYHLFDCVRKWDVE